MAAPKNFADLLREGIDEIQRKESIDKKKLRKEIYEELGKAAARSGSTIDYYLRDNTNTPKTIRELEILAKEIFRRGSMDRIWLEQFLAKGKHPNPISFYNEILSQSEISSGEAEQSEFLYKWLSSHYQIKRFPNRKIVTTTQVELLANSDTGLSSIGHRNTAEQPGELENLQLEFIPTRRDDKGRMSYKIAAQTTDILIWYVLFDPPLRKGQIVSYSYIQTIENCKYWTFEEYEPLFITANKRFAYQRRTIYAPTEELHFSMEFPPGYPITLPVTGGFNVYRTMAEDPIEKTRLITTNSFTAHVDPITKKWTLQLNLKNASIGLGYEIQWVPPRSNKIVA